MLFRCRPMSVPGLSLLGLKHIRGFISILRSINPTFIIIIMALKIKRLYLKRIRYEIGSQEFF